MSVNFVTLLELVAFALLGHSDFEFCRVNLLLVFLGFFFLWLFLFLRGFDVDNLDAEEKRTVCRDWAHSTATIGVVWRANQVCFGAFSQANKAIIPALDHLSIAYSER